MTEWTYNNPEKTKLAELLSRINPGRNLMIQCLEVYYFLDTDKLQKIYDGLSVNQKKALQGRAIKIIIDYKTGQL